MAPETLTPPPKSAGDDVQLPDRGQNARPARPRDNVGARQAGTDAVNAGRAAAGDASAAAQLAANIAVDVARGRPRRALRRLLILGALPLVGFAALMLVVVVVITAGGGKVQTPGAQSFQVYGVSQHALDDIPPEYLRIYQQAAKWCPPAIGKNCKPLDWALLAGIGSVETDHGRSKLNGVKSGFNDQAGAEGAGCCAGPMQFYANHAMANPTTWDAYGVDGNHDGKKDVYDPADAIPAAAWYLRANGAPDDWHRAVHAYNDLDSYEKAVNERAAAYRGAITRTVGGTPDEQAAPLDGAIGDVQVAYGTFVSQTTRPDGQRVLPNAWLSQFLAELAGRVGHTVYTNTYSNHDERSSSGLVSDHWVGNGADLQVTRFGGNYPNPYGTALAKAAFELCGISSTRASALANGGGDYTRCTWTWNGRSYSVQVLWGPTVSHTDHVHVGVRPA